MIMNDIYTNVTKIIIEKEAKLTGTVLSIIECWINYETNDKVKRVRNKTLLIIISPTLIIVFNTKLSVLAVLNQAD